MSRYNVAKKLSSSIRPLGTYPQYSSSSSQDVVLQLGNKLFAAIHSANDAREPGGSQVREFLAEHLFERAIRGE